MTIYIYLYCYKILTYIVIVYDKISYKNPPIQNKSIDTTFIEIGPLVPEISTFEHIIQTLHLY